MKNFKKVLHGIGALALSAVLLLGAGQTAKAAADSPSLDFSQAGSVAVTLKNTSGGTVTSGTLTIYEVAVLGYDDGNMAYTYTADFAGCTVDLAAVTQDSTDSSALAAIAGTLASYVSSNSVTGTSVNNTSGTVTFTDLELGLYLVVQTTASSGYETISPFVVTVPLDVDGEWVYAVDASPKVENLTAIPEEETTEEETPEEEADEDPGEEVVETVTETLVQTGQLNWPIPVLTVAGLVMILFGAILVKTDNRRRVRR